MIFLYGYLRLGGAVNGYARRCISTDGNTMFKTSLLPAFDLVSHSVYDELFCKSLGHALNHIVYEHPVEAVHCLVFLVVELLSRMSFPSSCLTFILPFTFCESCPRTLYHDIISEMVRATPAGMVIGFSYPDISPPTRCRRALRRQRCSSGSLVGHYALGREMTAMPEAFKTLGKSFTPA